MSAKTYERQNLAIILIETCLESKIEITITNYFEFEKEIICKYLKDSLKDIEKIKDAEHLIYKWRGKI